MFGLRLLPGSTESHPGSLRVPWKVGGTAPHDLPRHTHCTSLVCSGHCFPTASCALFYLDLITHPFWWVGRHLHPKLEGRKHHTMLTCYSHVSVCFAFIYHIHDFLGAGHKPLSAPLQQSQFGFTIKKLKSNNIFKQLNIFPLFFWMCKSRERLQCGSDNFFSLP